MSRMAAERAPHRHPGGAEASARRSGRTLRLLVAPHTAAILAALIGRSCGFAEVRDQLGDPSAEALLDRLEELIEIGRSAAGGHTRRDCRD